MRTDAIVLQERGDLLERNERDANFFAFFFIREAESCETIEPSQQICCKYLATFLERFFAWLAKTLLFGLAFPFLGLSACLSIELFLTAHHRN